jgi:hypothetical protein
LRDLWREGAISRNAPVTAAVYGVVDSARGPGRVPWGDGVQQRFSRSNDVEALAFVIALFGVLLALTVMLGRPIG